MCGFSLNRGAGDGRALKKGLVDLFSEGASLPRRPSKPDGVKKKATQQVAFEVEPEDWLKP